MHIMSLIAMGVGAVVVLVVGVLGVIRDLLIRGPHGSPLIHDELQWSSRYQGSIQPDYSLSRRSHTATRAGQYSTGP